MSRAYLGQNHKLTWRCRRGHIWDAVPMSVLHAGTWCARCAGVQKRSMKDASRVAKEREGRCLSMRYVGANAPLSWQCRLGHRWRNSLSNIEGGSWCPVCARKITSEKRRGRTFARAAKIAQERGGRCLSPGYAERGVALSWQCRRGHIWQTKISSILTNRWCPVCSKRVKGTIEEMRQIAR